MLVMTLLMMMRVSWWCWWWRCWWWWELADDVGDLVPHFLRWSIPVLVPDRARILGLEMSWQVLSKLTCLDRILDMLKIDRNRQVVIVDGQVRQLCVEDLAMLIESTNESLLLFVDWAAPVNLLRVLYAMHFRSNACRRTWELATLNICWWPAALRQSLADWSHAHACRPTTFDGSIGCPWASTPWPSTSCRRGREVLPKLLRLYLLTKRAPSQEFHTPSWERQALAELWHSSRGRLLLLIFLCFLCFGYFFITWCWSLLYN